MERFTNRILCHPSEDEILSDGELYLNFMLDNTLTPQKINEITDALNLRANLTPREGIEPDENNPVYGKDCEKGRWYQCVDSKQWIVCMGRTTEPSWNAFLFLGTSGKPLIAYCCEDLLYPVLPAMTTVGELTVGQGAMVEIIDSIPDGPKETKLVRLNNHFIDISGEDYSRIPMYDSLARLYWFCTNTPCRPIPPEKE